MIFLVEYSADVTEISQSQETPSVRFGMPIDDLDMNKKVHCGGNKCFFNSKSRPEIGYLVTDNYHDHGHDNLYRMKKAFNMGKRLQKRFGFAHFMANKPSIIELNSDAVEYINNSTFPVKFNSIKGELVVANFIKSPIEILQLSHPCHFDKYLQNVIGV